MKSTPRRAKQAACKGTEQRMGAAHHHPPPQAEPGGGPGGPHPSEDSGDLSHVSSVLKPLVSPCRGGQLGASLRRKGWPLPPYLSSPSTTQGWGPRAYQDFGGRAQGLLVLGHDADVKDGREDEDEAGGRGGTCGRRRWSGQGEPCSPGQVLPCPGEQPGVTGTGLRAAGGGHVGGPGASAAAHRSCQRCQGWRGQK